MAQGSSLIARCGRKYSETCDVMPFGPRSPPMSTHLRSLIVYITENTGLSKGSQVYYFPLLLIVAKSLQRCKLFDCSY